jgi:predicted RNA-binding protein with PIN domain
MAYLIDGNNLLGRIAPHELVFDGNPEATPTDMTVNPKFTIHFPGEGRSADDVIKDMIGRQTDRRRFFVVSSDRAIRDLARRKGFESLTSDVFARELKAAIKEGKKRRELEKRAEAPTHLEIDLWDEMFRSRR